MSYQKVSNTLGFRTDIEELFSRFESQDISSEGSVSLRFSRFSKIWREMKFSFVFALRININDMRDFVELLYFEVLPFICCEHPLERRVCAFYLLYGLFHKQPQTVGRPIRIGPTLLEELRDLISRCKDLDQLDVCYVWYKLWSKGAFDVVFTTRDVSPEYKYSPNEMSAPTDNLYNNLKSRLNPALKELSQIHENYFTLKRELKIDRIVENNSNVVVEDIYKKMRQMLDQIMNKKLTDRVSNNGKVDTMENNIMGLRTNDRKVTHIIRNNKNKHKLDEPNGYIKTKRPRGRPRLK